MATGACGNLTSGGFGEVEVVLTSQAVEELDAALHRAAALSLAPHAEAPSQASNSNLSLGPPQLEGTLLVRVRSFALDGSRGGVELTNGLQEVTLSLRDPVPVELARRELPEGEYRGVRTVLGRVEAVVVQGLDMNGVPVTGTIQVDLGPTGTLDIRTDTPFQVRAGDGTQVALEMRSRVWLRLVDAARRVVPEEALRNALRIRIESRRPD